MNVDEKYVQIVGSMDGSKKMVQKKDYIVFYSCHSDLQLYSHTLWNIFKQPMFESHASSE
jgi:hypothetical protein